MTPPDSKKRRGDSDWNKQAAVLESAAMIQGRQKSSKAVHSSSPFGDSVPNHADLVLPLFSEGGTFFWGCGWLAIHKKKHTVFFLPLKNTTRGFFAEEELRCTFIFTQMSTQILEKKGQLLYLFWQPSC